MGRSNSGGSLTARIWSDPTFFLCVFILAWPSFGGTEDLSGSKQSAVISGELRKWHRVSLTFSGPETSETGTPNPFRDYRLTVIFTNGEKIYRVPGFYAADGNAAESGAESGDKWRVHFTPDEEGEWHYSVIFRRGTDISIGQNDEAGEPAPPDGLKGSFTVGPSDKMGRDHRGKGMLRYVGRRYLRFADKEEWYLKGGADSPENFLAYVEFDGTFFAGTREPTRPGEATPYEKLHLYKPHLQDWQPGDPVWRGNKGKGIIGALNYLSQKGMNAVYFLTMNVGGDGKDVWPWIRPDIRDRFDCSKLDQWEIVFSHMDTVGILMHVVTQETENDQLLDGGELGVERRLYYRELIARFSHHLALIWNLGEENTNTKEQREEFARFIHDLDPYDHPIVMHTHPGRQDEIYTPLLRFPFFHGVSIQINMRNVHSETEKWVRRSRGSNRPWVVCLDEIGPARHGVLPDSQDYRHDDVRKYALWGNLMAGGGGCEWYFGYEFPNNDLSCEDWRSRDHLWDITRYALDFFHRFLPFAEMEPNDSLTNDRDDYCFAKKGGVYAIYLPSGGTTDLGLEKGTYTIQWYNPRTGDGLEDGSIREITGPGWKSIGYPPREVTEDWVALVKRK